MYTFYEISEILRYMPSEYKEKLPEKFITLINKNKRSNGFIYNKEKSLDNQGILHDTKILLSILYREYWCSEDKRRELEKEDYNILKAKYNSEDIFKKKKELQKKSMQTVEETKLKVIQEEKWYQKMFYRIKRIFKRK